MRTLASGTGLLGFVRRSTSQQYGKAIGDEDIKVLNCDAHFKFRALTL